MHSSRMRTAGSSSHWGWGVCLSACWDRPPWVGLETPWVWAWRPPQLPLGCGPGHPLARSPSTSLGCEPGDTPGQIPLNFPPGCGPGNLQGMLGYHPPGDLLQGMLGYHLQCMLGYHPPVNRITDTCKNITLPQLRCGR